MNHEEKRKVFDKWVLTHPDNLDLTAYEENIMFDAWLAAQNQEGFAVVPVEPTRAMEIAGMNAGAGFVSRSIYKAMIQEAQK